MALAPSLRQPLPVGVVLCVGVSVVPEVLPILVFVKYDEG